MQPALTDMLPLVNFWVGIKLHIYKVSSAYIKPIERAKYEVGKSVYVGFTIAR